MNLADILKKNDKKSKKKNAAKVAAGVGLGALAGAVAGTLLAPKAGKETREDIAKGAKDTYEKAKTTVNEAKDKLAKTIEDKKIGKSCCEGENTEETVETTETVTETTTKEE